MRIHPGIRHAILMIHTNRATNADQSIGPPTDVHDDPCPARESCLFLPSNGSYRGGGLTALLKSEKYPLMAHRAQRVGPGGPQVSVWRQTVRLIRAAPNYQLPGKTEGPRGPVISAPAARRPLISRQCIIMKARGIA
jgi:hypothetical protein